MKIPEGPDSAMESAENEEEEEEEEGIVPWLDDSVVYTQQ